MYSHENALTHVNSNLHLVEWAMIKILYQGSASNGSFPPSGTGQYSMVRYNLGLNTLIQLAFPPPTVLLLDRRGICRKVPIENKAWQ